MFTRFLAEKKSSKFDRGLFVLLWVVFGAILFLVAPIWSPDTYSYFSVPIHRFPVYSLVLRGFEFLLGRDAFGLYVVFFQLVVGYIAIRLVYDRCAHVFSLSRPVRLVLLLILAAPYAPPLHVGSNLASEGLAYPLYLMVISFAIDFLFRKQPQQLLWLALTFIGLCLTRGQFIIMAPIIAVVFLFHKKKHILKWGNLKHFLILILLPFLVKGIDSSFHKVVHGYFVSTPYSYVNAVTLPLFVAKWQDSSAISNPDYKHLFVQSYATIDSLGYTRARTMGDSRLQYENFHDHFPMICNQNLHDKGRAYFFEKEGKEHLNAIRTEQASKALLPILISQNTAAYWSVYFEGILEGFKSILLLLFFVGVLLYSCWRVLRRYSAHNAFILLGSTLILSNALIVGFACHSIERYLFYNYFIAFLIVILTLRKLIPRI
ncbi:MAG: hypothetical protein CL867_08680 [Cytophagaceae bacterium]|nr:hypothetical protein [Cytophagaceae bacterium]